MNTATYFAFVGLVALLLFLNNGVSSATTFAVAVVAVLSAIPWYFGTRDITSAPGTVERFLATSWEWFRRFIGFSVGALCLWIGWNLATSRFPTGSVGEYWFAVVGLIAFGILLFYFGAVGQGPNRFDWRDDAAHHRRNRARYKWWF